MSAGDTQTSRIIEERSLGYVLDEDSSEALIAFVDHLDRGALTAHSDRLLEMPPERFAASAEDTRELLTALRRCLAPAKHP